MFEKEDEENSKAMFNRIPKNSYPQLIAERIQEMIVEKSLMPGAKLPSERNMAEQFGVSRASTREAIRLLDALGLVEIRTGDGTYVKADLATSVVHPLTWALSMFHADESAYIEFRVIVETSIAALAAQRADEKDFQELEANLEEMEKAVGNHAATAEKDLEFHMILARAARNQLLYESLNGLQKVLRSHLAVSHLSLQQQQRALDEHLQIFDAIRNRNSARAKYEMAKSVGRNNPIANLFA